MRASFLCHLLVCLQVESASAKGLDVEQTQQTESAEQVERWLIVWGDNTLAIKENDTIQLDLHKSHRPIILCGGYAGCEKCGRITSTNTRRNNLVQPCRGYMPGGTKDPVKKLADGKFPFFKKRVWPSGEDQPRPKRIRMSLDRGDDTSAAEVTAAARCSTITSMQCQFVSHIAFLCFAGDQIWVQLSGSESI